MHAKVEHTFRECQYLFGKKSHLPDPSLSFAKVVIVVIYSYIFIAILVQLWDVSYAFELCVCWFLFMFWIIVFHSLTLNFISFYTWSCLFFVSFEGSFGEELRALSMTLEEKMKDLKRFKGVKKELKNVEFSSWKISTTPSITSCIGRADQSPLQKLCRPLA